MLVKLLHHHPMVTTKPTEGDGKPGPEPERVKIEGDWEEAVKRALEKKRPPRTGFAALNAAKTHCPQGHPYSAENTYVSPQGKRFCRACHRRHALAHQRKAKG
jgi:hypothetical protein